MLPLAASHITFTLCHRPIRRAADVRRPWPRCVRLPAANVRAAAAREEQRNGRWSRHLCGMVRAGRGWERDKRQGVLEGTRKQAGERERRGRGTGGLSFRVLGIVLRRMVALPSLMRARSVIIPSSACLSAAWLRSAAAAAWTCCCDQRSYPLIPGYVKPVDQYWNRYCVTYCIPYPRLPYLLIV